MDIEKSFTFQFKDPQWLNKLGLGAVIALVPILNFAFSGYLIDLIRNVSENVPEPLPRWDEMEQKFKKGFIHLAAGFVYALPLLIVICLPLGLATFSGLLSGNRNLQGAANAVATAGGVVFYCLLCVFAIYLLGLSVIYPAILVLFAREGTFASCFKFREVIDLISRNAGPFFTAWGLSLVSGLGMGVVVGIVNVVIGWIPCVGWIVAVVSGLGSSVYLSTIYAHLFGQFSAIAFGQAQGTGRA